MKENDVELSEEEQKLAQEAMGPRRSAKIAQDNSDIMPMSVASMGGSKVYKDGKLIVAQRKAKRQAQRNARRAQRS